MLLTVRRHCCCRKSIHPSLKNCSEEVMYRIVFVSLCPHRKTVVVEKGPMHPEKEKVEKWLNYFLSVGYPARMRIESV
jgi:hypothetical protein